MANAENLFEQQIRDRKKRDYTQMSRSLQAVADAVLGREHFSEEISYSEEVQRAVELICVYFHVPVPENIPSTQDETEIIDYMTRPSGVLHRRVRLQEIWWKDGDGPLLAKRKDSGKMEALFPGRFSGYYRINEKTGKRERISGSTQGEYCEDAVCFYRPLPQTELNGKKLIRLLLRTIAPGDYLMILLTALLVTLVGMITPFATSVIFSTIIPTGTSVLVISIGVVLLTAALAIYLISVVTNGIMDRVRGRMEVFLQNAAMGRVIHLSPHFFNDKSSGELAQSISSLQLLPTVLVDALINPCIKAVFSVFYIIQIAVFSAELALPAFLILILQGVVIAVSIRQKYRMARDELAATAKNQSMVFALISGIQRIRLSGSEERALSKWAESYKGKAGAAYCVKFPAVVQTELVAAVALLGMLWAYAVGVRTGIGVSRFAAFLSAYGLVTVTMNQFSQTSDTLAYLNPILRMVEPILKERPEVSSGKRYLTKLRGEISINHVSFRYNADQPLIISDVSLNIHPGEYVAIVGKSGCGKSTLLRLLMGFETPEEGSVLYDDVNVTEIDPGSLRRNIGTVLQDGKLFVGDIFSNIAISSPQLTTEEAWEAARMAGMEETIKKMPMGMHTVISEGSGGISGGQKQRLLIARAIASKPQILMFDEATSALDNITQKVVSDSLASLGCTRIVVAHRLSTIRQCDRVIVMDRGKIVEDGPFDVLEKSGGFFSELIARQQI